MKPGPNGDVPSLRIEDLDIRGDYGWLLAGFFVPVPEQVCVGRRESDESWNVDSVGHKRARIAQRGRHGLVRSTLPGKRRRKGTLREVRACMNPPNGERSRFDQASGLHTGFAAHWSWGHVYRDVMKADGSVDHIVRSKAQYAAPLTLRRGFPPVRWHRACQWATSLTLIHAHWTSRLARLKTCFSTEVNDATHTHHTRCPDTLGRERGGKSLSAACSGWCALAPRRTAGFVVRLRLGT